MAIRGLRRIELLTRTPTLRSRPASYPPMSEAAQKDYPEFAADFSTLAQVVLPRFTEYDETALKRQNQYRLTKTIVLFGAALLTGLGGLQAVFPDQRWPAAVLIVLSIVLGTASQILGESKGMDEYMQARLKAERLRALYFTYLSGHSANLDARARVARLESAVLAIESGQEAE